MAPQQLMAGVYFKAQEEITPIDEFEGEQGMFLKTFAINDKRNKNGWKALWQGIKDKISTFKGRPGIEFIKCTTDGCDLDHTEAQTKELSLEVQEPYRVSTIIGIKLDEETHTAYFVHKVHDAEFFQRVKNKEIKAVSPSIWPNAGGFEVIGHMENGQPMIDVWDWDALHDAFVNKPAFGDDAKITAICEGDDCPVKLLSAKEKTVQLTADAIQDCVSSKISNMFGPGEKPDEQKLAIFFSECRKQLSGIVDQGDLQHLQEVPLLVQHNKKKRFLTVSKVAYAVISKLLAEGKEVDEIKVYEIIHQDKENTSFSSCTCSGNQKMEDEEKKQFESKIQAMEHDKKELESKLTAQDKDEEKQHEARKARYVASFKAMEHDEDKEKMAIAIRAMEDEKEIKAMEEAEKEVKTAKKGMKDDEHMKAAEDEKKELKSSVVTLEATIATPLIERMAQARTLKGATDDQIKEFKKSYEEKSLKAVQSDYDKESILIEEQLAAAEAEAPVEQKSFPLMGSSQGALAAKSLEDTFDEVNN